MKKIGPVTILWWTLGLVGLPFVIYAVERQMGVLSTASEWYATKTNHGPWRWGVEGFTVFYPVLVLLLITIIKVVGEGVKNKDRKLQLRGLGLVALQIAGLMLQLMLLSWTVG